MYKKNASQKRTNARRSVIQWHNNNNEKKTKIHTLNPGYIV